MAVRIPTYEARLTPDGSITARASAMEQSGAVGAALVNMGNVIERAADQMFKEVTEARVREVDNEASESIRSMLYDPENGYLAKTGKAAVDGYQTTQEAIRKLQKDLSGKLSTDAQRRMFADVMDRRVQSALGSVASHAAQQGKVYNQGQADARASMAMADAIANYSDTAVFNRSMATALQEAGFGKDGEVAEAARREVQTKTHVGVINQMLSQNRAAMAREWFAKYQGQIDPTVQDDVRKALEGASVREDSLDLSIKLQSVGGYDAQRKALKDMYAAGTISAEVYDQAATRIDQERVRRDAQKAEYNNSMEGQAQDWILKNPGRSPLEMPPGLYAWARNNGRLDSLASFARSSGKPDGNDQKFTDLIIKAADDPMAFVREFDKNNATWRTELSESQYNSLLSRRAAISKGDLRAQDATVTAARAVTALNADLRAAGIDTTAPEGSVTAKQFATFKSALIGAIDAATQAKGSALTMDEARKVGLGLLQEGTLKGSGTFWDTTKRRFEVTAEERARYPFISTSYQNIPAEEKRAIWAKITNSPELQKRMGLTPADLRGTPKMQRAVEMLYQAKTEGVQF